MSFEIKDQKGPSVAELQNLVRAKTRLEFQLSTGRSMHGRLRWFDELAFGLIEDDESSYTLLRTHVIGYRAKAKKEK